MSTARDLERKCQALARQIELFQCRNTSDAGAWLTKAAQRQHSRLERRLEKLDEEYDRALSAEHPASLGCNSDEERVM